MSLTNQSYRMISLFRLIRFSLFPFHFCLFSLFFSFFSYHQKYISSAPWLLEHSIDPFAVDAQRGSLGESARSIENIYVFPWSRCEI